MKNFNEIFKGLEDFKHRSPIYDSFSDYNTNSKSYYDYLARFHYLMKILVERVAEYDKELAKRFEEWDKLIEKYPENVEKLLIEWLDDGKLADILRDSVNDEVVEARNKKDKNTYDRLSQRLDAMENNVGMINFCFDDGFSEDKLTYSIFSEYGFVCDFALITDIVNNYNGVGFYHRIAKEGFGVLSHGRSNIDLRGENVDYNVARNEIVSSKEVLRDLEFDVSGFVSPNSYVHDSYKSLIEKNYDYAVNVAPTNLPSNAPMLKDESPLKIHRMSLYNTDISLIKQTIDRVAKERLSLFFYDHRTGASGNNVTEEKLREVLNYVKQKVNLNEIKVLRSKDLVRNYFGVSDSGVNVKYVGENLAPPLFSTVKTGFSEPYFGVWFANSNPWNANVTPIYNYNRKNILMTYDSVPINTKTYLQTHVSTTMLANDSKPHMVNFSLPIRMYDNLDKKIKLTLNVRSYTKDMQQIGIQESVRCYAISDNILVSEPLTIKSRCEILHVFVQLETLAETTGRIELGQPSIMLDCLSHNYSPSKQLINCTVNFKSTLTSRMWTKLNTVTLENTKTIENLFIVSGNSLKIKETGNYIFRYMVTFELSDIDTSINSRILSEIRVNSENVETKVNRISSAKNEKTYYLNSEISVYLTQGDLVDIMFYSDVDDNITAESRSKSRIHVSCILN